MSWGIVAGAVSSIAGSVISSSSASDASQDASDAQLRATQMQIDESGRQFDEIRALLEPYSTAGVGSLSQQRNFLGLNGANAQAGVINELKNSFQFNDLAKQGENAILQNASATGGLRGGNVQASLAQFRPRLLSELIDKQYGRLSGMTTVGQNAAAGVGAAGQVASGQTIAALGQQGAIQAGNSLAQGRANQNLIGGISQAAGGLAGLFGGGGGGGGFFGGGGGGGSVDFGTGFWSGSGIV
jgi:hypothetical protein